MEPWVVTYQSITTHETLITEFYRGSREECLRIRDHSASSGEDDQYPTKEPWKIVVSPVSHWDMFVRSAIMSGEYVEAHHQGG